MIHIITLFSTKQISAVNVKIGNERIFTILEEKYKKDDNIGVNETDILIASVVKINLLRKRLEIENKLWKLELKQKYYMKIFQKQINK